jgi:hypothetical protein
MDSRENRFMISLAVSPKMLVLQSLSLVHRESILTTRAGVPQIARSLICGDVEAAERVERRCTSFWSTSVWDILANDRSVSPKVVFGRRSAINVSVSVLILQNHLNFPT